MSYIANVYIYTQIYRFFSNLCPYCNLVNFHNVQIRILLINNADYRSKFISATQFFYYLPFLLVTLTRYFFPICLFAPSCKHRPDSILAIVRRYLWPNMWDIHYDDLPDCRYYLPFRSTVTRSVKHATP